MKTRVVIRLLIPALALVPIVAGVLIGPAFKADAIENLSWTESESQENVMVQACNGFNLTTSYTIERDHQLFTEHADGLFLERTTSSFAGAIGNSVTGKSYAYDGRFTRWDDRALDQVTITGLDFRFEVGTPGQFFNEIERMKYDLPAHPAEIVKQLVPNALQLELCFLLADSLNGNVAPVGAPTTIESQIAPAIEVVDFVITENLGLEQAFPPYNGPLIPNRLLDMPSETGEAQIIAPYDERSVSNLSVSLPTANSMDQIIADLERLDSDSESDAVPGYGPGCDVISNHGKPCG